MFYGFIKNPFQSFYLNQVEKFAHNEKVAGSNPVEDTI